MYSSLARRSDLVVSEIVEGCSETETEDLTVAYRRLVMDMAAVAVDCY